MTSYMHVRYDHANSSRAVESAIETLLDSLNSAFEEADELAEGQKEAEVAEVVTEHEQTCAKIREIGNRLIENARGFDDGEDGPFRDSIGELIDLIADLPL